MVGAAASALADLRPGAPGPATTTSTSTAPTNTYPPPFVHQTDPNSPLNENDNENSATDSQASDDEYDGEHGGHGASVGGRHGSGSAAPSHGGAAGTNGSVSEAPAVATSTTTSTSAALDIKKPRACEACRGLKVRCDMDPNAPADTPCRRCAKAGRTCIVTQPTRRRQKKTDSRVAELEKKIDALTASLQLTRQSPSVPASNIDTNTNTKDDESGRPSSGHPPVGAGFLRNWPPTLDPPMTAAASRSTAKPAVPPVAPTPAPNASREASKSTPTPAAPSHSPYSTGSAGRSTYSSVPPPMVMAGQKRKFSEIREATGVVGAGAGGGPGSRASLGSRAGSTPGDESPSVRENPYGYHTHHSHQSSHQRYNQDKHPQTQPSQQSPGFGMPPSPAAAGVASSTTRLSTEYADIIDRGFLTMDKAVELFQRYTDHMAKHMPAVVFPPGTTAAEIRKTKPVLFISLMAAATTETPEVQRAIVKEMMQVFAEKVFITGEKSLEIVQALQVSVIWYWPPENFEELKFYQLVHTAAVMAIDIGLGKRRPGSKCNTSCAGGTANSSMLRRGLSTLGNSTGARFHDRGATTGSATVDADGDGNATNESGHGSGSGNGNGRRGGPFSNWRDHPFKKYPLPDPSSIEARRAWLACYFLTSNTAMALHRPTLFRWTSFMTECVEVLESSPDAAPTDQYFCHLVWTHRMAEEVGQQFSMDDPSTVINIADPRTQYALRGFERELERYKATIPRNLLQPCLRLSFEVVSLYMHEIALQTENGNDEFRAPYTAESTKEALIGDATLTPAHIRALTSCLLSIDGIFDAFLGMDIAALRCIPVFNFVRVAYATVVMIKLYLFASSPNSELGKVINKEHMKVEQHLNALLDKFRATAAGNKSRPAGKFMIVLAMVRSWFLKQQAFESRGEQPEGASGQHGHGHGRAQPQHPPLTSVPSGPLQPNQSKQQNQPQAKAAPTTQPYVPSSGLLSTINNVSNGNTNGASASPSTAATSTPTSSASYSVPLQQPYQHQQQPQMQSAAMYPTANTPLQLLSEIAANDYAATAAASSAQQQQQQQHHPQQQQAQQQPIPPWPPFYASMPGNGNPSAAPPQPPQQPSQQTQPPLMQPPMSSSDYMSLYPHLSLGENFEYAVDLTFGGLSEGANELNLSDGLQYILADPWFGGNPGELFQL